MRKPSRSKTKVRSLPGKPAAPIDLDVDETRAIAEACFGDLRLFIEEAWPVVVPAEPFQEGFHIDAICEHLEAVYKLQIRNLLINVPPRFGKSVCSSVGFPAWVWLRDPTRRFLYSSYAQDLSTRDSLATRQLIESKWYQSNWGSVYQLNRQDQNVKTRFENNVKGYRLATAVKGANTGEGGDIIVCDDPHNVKEAESEVVRTEAVRWWNEVMATRGNNPSTACRIVIMQRSHEKDLAGDILDKGGYEHLNLPMEYEAKVQITVPSTIGWTDPRKEEGELLWPKRFGQPELAQMKRSMGTYASAAQLQQRPAPREGGMFKRDKWKYYKVDPTLLLEGGGINDKCWSWDCAFKDLDDSDFVVGTAWARKGADFYLLHRIRDRMSFGGTKQAIKNGKAKFPSIGYVLVEDKANGTAVIDDLKHTVGGLVPIEPQGGKEARASVVEPYQEAGNIYLPDPSIAPWVEDFVAEFAAFPKGANDDQVDSTSQAIVWMLNRAVKGQGGIVKTYSKSWVQSHTAQGERPLRDPRYS